MKIPLLLCCLGVFLGFQPTGYAALNRQNNILGKFLVSSARGEATCVTDGRILELKKGETIVARGAIITTGPKSNTVLVFSNGTAVYADENTELRIERFEQEFFAPNNNLRVEPSNSSTTAKLVNGRVVISTPRLQSATTMNYQTRHASVFIRGEKLLIEASEKQTHVAMISGNATVNPRDAKGNFISIGKRLSTGQEAFVKPIIGSQRGKPSGESGMQVTSAATSGAASAAVEAVPAEGPNATVLGVVGTASVRSAGSGEETPLTAGSLLSTGSIIVTGAASRIHLQTFVGAIATVLPDSVVQIERLSLSPNRATSQASLLALQSGELVSTIDPAGNPRNEYMVRTLQGTARAHGTAFATSSHQGGFSLAATADTVSFTTPSGSSYEISAGHVVMTGPGRDSAAPVPLAQAVAADPAFAGLIQTAFATAVTLARENVGTLSAASTLNLLTKIAASVSTALPDRAEQFATEAVSAVSMPTSALAGQSSPATAALIHAVTGATPDRAASISAAVAQAFPAQAPTIAGAAAKAAPGQTAQIAFEVARTVLQPSQTTGVTDASLQQAAAIAAAVTSSANNQAGPVAAAVMQAVLRASPNPEPETIGKQGALIASVVTKVSPSQAVPVARAMMQTLTQELTEGTPQVLTRLAALVAGSVIAVVPPQAQPVATAVMQFLVETYPNTSSDSMREIAGLFTATMAQVAPNRAREAVAGVSAVTGLSTDVLLTAATRYSDFAGRMTAEIAAIGQMAQLAFQQGSSAAEVLFAGLQLAQVPPFAAGADDALGFGANSPTEFGQSELNNATSIVITQFNPEQVSELTSDLEAAQAAQVTVQFYTETDSTGSTTVRPAPTVPRTVPVDTIASPSSIGL